MNSKKVFITGTARGGTSIIAQMLSENTEINISRFFTTVLFFTEAGLNMPKMFKDIILYNEFPKLEKKINPLPDGLMWLRGMDYKPVLSNEQEIKNEFISL